MYPLARGGLVELKLYSKPCLDPVVSNMALGVNNWKEHSKLQARVSMRVVFRVVYEGWHWSTA